MSILGLENLHLTKRKISSEEGFFDKLKDLKESIVGGPFTGKTWIEIYKWGETVIKGLNDDQWKKLAGLQISIRPMNVEITIVRDLPGAYRKLLALYRNVKANPPDMSDWDNLEKEEYDPVYEACEKWYSDPSVNRLNDLCRSKPNVSLLEGKWTKQGFLATIPAIISFEKSVNEDVVGRLQDDERPGEYVIREFRRIGNSELDICKKAVRLFGLK